MTWNVTVALLSLLSALATARDEIMDAIVANPQIMPFICFLVSHNSTPSTIFSETLSCLIIMTEDNLKVSQLILADQSNCFRTLTKFKEAGDSRAVYACAVLHNIYSALEWHDGSPGQDGATDSKLIPNLSQVLERTRQDPKTYQVGGVEIEVVTLALEILASIATDLQGSVAKGNKKQEEWNGFEDKEAMEDGDDEDMEQLDDDEEDEEDDADGVGADGANKDADDDIDMDDAMEADMDFVTGEGDEAEDDAGIEDLPTLREFILKAIPQLIRLANFAPASEEAVAIQLEALAGLNNIAWTMSCFDYSESGNAGILRVWDPIAKRIWSELVAPVLATDTADISLASLVTSIAWAIARTLQGSTPLAGDEHHKFISLYKASKGLVTNPDEQAQQGEQEDPFQGLGVKCIGVLGQLAQDPAPIDLNREVGVFLVTILDALPETPPADTVEALNQLMDIYADETHPCVKAVFWKDNFLKHLEDVLPKTKKMVKSIDKRGPTSELRTRADEAIMNLGRFIQYTKKHPPRP